MHFCIYPGGKMKFSLKQFSKIFILFVFLIANKTSFAQNNNNAFVFNGETSQVYVLDGSPANGDANQNGFAFFNSSTAQNQITVQAWTVI